MDVPAIRLIPEPVDDSTVVGFRSAGPEIGYRHRIGGEPSAAPRPWPACPSCTERMTFYGQLDSINDEVVLADVGVVLVFVCFGCFEATAQIGST